MGRPDHPHSLGGDIAIVFLLVGGLVQLAWHLVRALVKAAFR